MSRLGLLLFVLLACAPIDRADCAIWSDEPGDEICERCDIVALEDIMLADGTIVRAPACQGDAP